ncbi:hypothetical protein FKM82_007742 [Ascaphus truei]
MDTLNLWPHSALRNVQFPHNSRGSLSPIQSSNPASSLLQHETRDEPPTIFSSRLSRWPFISCGSRKPIASHTATRCNFLFDGHLNPSMKQGRKLVCQRTELKIGRLNSKAPPSFPSCK